MQYRQRYAEKMGLVVNVVNAKSKRLMGLVHN